MTEDYKNGIKVDRNVDVDLLKGPYRSIAEANAKVTPYLRSVSGTTGLKAGRTVIIDDGTTRAEYWWDGGTADSNLIAKSTGGGGAVDSVFGRNGTVIATAGDYDSFYYTKALSDARYAAIGVVGITLNSETAVYATEMAASGAALTASEIIALDTFVSTSKKDGTWSLIILFNPFGVSGNYAGAANNFKYPSGFATLTMSAGMTSGDFLSKVGFSVGTNSPGINKWIDTGVVFDTYSASSFDVGFGFIIPPQNPVVNITNNLLALNPVSGTDNLKLGTLTFGDVSRNALGNYPLGPIVGTYSFFTNQLASAYVNGARSFRFSAPSARPTANFSTSMTIYKGTSSGATTYGTGTISGLVMTKGLTDAQNKALNNNLVVLYKSLNITETNPLTLGVFGDSISGGTGASNYYRSFSYTLSKNLGCKLLNLAVPSSILATANLTNNIATGELKYPDLYTLGLNYLFSIYGTNDMILKDPTVGSANATVLAAYQTAYTTVLTNLNTNLNGKLIVGTVPWNSASTASSSTKNAQYVGASVAAAKAAGIKLIVDLYNIFIDTGSPSSYFGDGTHPNDTGQTLITAHLLAAMQGRIYRDAPVAFASAIIAGANATATVAMYGSVVGQTVIITAPIGLDESIELTGKVTAADTVTITARNTGITSVTPGTIIPRTTVFID